MKTILGLFVIGALAASTAVFSQSRQSSQPKKTAIPSQSRQIVAIPNFTVTVSGVSGSPCLDAYNGTHGLFANVKDGWFMSAGNPTCNNWQIAYYLSPNGQATVIFNVPTGNISQMPAGPAAVYSGVGKSVQLSGASFGTWPGSISIN